MYTFKTNIDINEYINYLHQHDVVNFMQEPAWANVKNNFGQILCGLYQDNKLVAACQILVRNIKFGIKLFYIPRGYVMDLTNFELLNTFTKEIKKLAKKRHAYVVKIDPNVCLNEYLFKNKELLFPKFLSNNVESIGNNFKKSGYVHTGYFKDFTKTFQPRFNMAAPLVDENGNHLTCEDFLKTIKSKHRQYLDKYHDVRGITFEVTNDINRLKDFVDILKYTEKTQKITLRNEEYFRRLLTNFPNRAYFIFGKINLGKYLEYLENNNGKEEEILKTREWLKKETELTVSTGLLLLPDEHNKIKISEYLYAGNNLEFGKLNIAAGVCLEAINFSIKNGCDLCNLGGVDGNFNDHLSIYKSKFNALVLEFIGEYDLIINKPLYYLAKLAYPIIKKIK